MSIKENFYNFMCRKKTIEHTCDSGRKFIIDYHRSTFWSYEKPSLKLFFKEKLSLWHGHVWLVYGNGSKSGFGTCCIHALFPRRIMKRYLLNESKRLEDIFNNENS